jgi:hypothetical protein
LENRIKKAVIAIKHAEYILISGGAGPFDAAEFIYTSTRFTDNFVLFIKIRNKGYIFHKLLSVLFVGRKVGIFQKMIVSLKVLMSGELERRLFWVVLFG